MIKNKTAITISEFAEKLTAGGGVNPSPADCAEYGMKCGWLDRQDITGKEKPLLRKQAARIIYNYLRFERKEADVIDGSPAYVLRDLFDCRVCAGHIIQVYVKGIMDGIVSPEGDMLFAAEEEISGEEAEEIVKKVFREECRTVRAVTDSGYHADLQASEISRAQALEMMRENKDIWLVDVRSAREYETEHRKGAVNVPVLDIIKNPFIFNEKRYKTILIYCNEGHQSKIAARCLLEAGYEKVAYFKWK